jgi:hypothetical protein
VTPDGELASAGSTAATFEAKYVRRGTGEWPEREHVYQTLTTAAVCGSPLAVLVYPEQFDTVWWQVKGFKGSPSHLAAIGLGLYSYRRGTGDETRGSRLLDLLAARPAFAPTASVDSLPTPLEPMVGEQRAAEPSRTYRRPD